VPASDVEAQGLAADLLIGAVGGLAGNLPFTVSYDTETFDNTGWTALLTPVNGLLWDGEIDGAVTESDRTWVIKGSGMTGPNIKWMFVNAGATASTITDVMDMFDINITVRVTVGGATITQVLTTPKPVTVTRIPNDDQIPTEVVSGTINVANTNTGTSQNDDFNMRLTYTDMLKGNITSTFTNPTGTSLANKGTFKEEPAVDFTVTSIPEPTSVLLLASGFGVIAMMVRLTRCLR
jgi:hypothetical protein